ncbi:MAG: tRNA pseudouridine(55) synthase TruB [Buchnera aphidicola (Eriosoma harunire)]
MKSMLDINGVLLLDKSKGKTSYQVLKEIKNMFLANKAGHTGSLDPLATGMLPIFFGESTKFIQYALNADKQYLVIAKLGVKTSTSDAEGEIIKIRAINVTKKQLCNQLGKFLGNVYQIPSMYSAIKYKGTPLYKYARKGIVINRSSRKITIYNIDCIFFNQKYIKLNIFCSKGTYIRTLVDDLGEQLGCGAHVVSLRRIQVDSYPMRKLVTIDQLYLIKNWCIKKKLIVSSYINKLLLPIDYPLLNFKTIKVTNIELKKLIVGQHIQLNKIFRITEIVVRIVDVSLKFVGVGYIDHRGILIPKRLISQE